MPLLFLLLYNLDPDDSGLVMLGAAQLYEVGVLARAMDVGESDLVQFDGSYGGLADTLIGSTPIGTTFSR